MIWGRAASSRRDGGERGRLYRISGARQLPCMAAGGKKRATTAVRVRGGGRRCSSLSPRGRGGGKPFPLHSDGWEGDVPAVSNARRRGRFPSGCEARGFVACFFDAAAWWREAPLFLIAAGWERGKPLPLHSDGWEGDVPAVSNARRLVDRLQGGQHCRRALEIRSEVSAPALMVPRYLGTVRKVSSLLFSGSGGLGLRLEALRFFRAFHLRPPSLATAGSARTRQGTLGSLDSPSAAASSDERTFHLEAKAQAVTTTAQRRQFVLCSPQKCTAAGCAVTMAAQPAS